MNINEKLDKPRELPRLLTLHEVRAVFRVSTQTLRYWIDEGWMPATRIGKTTRVPREWLLEKLGEAGSEGTR